VAAAARRHRRALRIARPDTVAAPGAASRMALRSWPVRDRPELDRDLIHLSIQHAGLARLDRGRSAFPLPRRLSRARGGRRLVVRARRPRRHGDGSRRRVGDQRMAARLDVHGLSLEPCGCCPCSDAADRGYSADRDLRPVGTRRSSRRRDLARILQEMAAASRHPRDVLRLRAVVARRCSWGHRGDCRAARCHSCAVDVVADQLCRCRSALDRFVEALHQSRRLRNGGVPRDAWGCYVGGACRRSRVSRLSGNRGVDG